MTPLRQRMLEDLQLAGYAPRTVKHYIDTVRVLAKYYGRSPDLLTEEEVRRFFLHLI
jgi:integrase/recombinase XerD